MLALVLTIGIFGAFRFRGPTYGVLFSNLSADDANAVVTRLKEQRVPYQLSNNGTTVLIPQERVADERVALAGSGVVKGGSTGFELFDRTNLGMTDFQEKIAKTRATEGELQRTLESLSPVESARVHIATPQASLYSSTQQPTTASIAVKTKPGLSLDPQAVRGITMLTVGAVEGLKPENVTIVNQSGDVLVPAANDGQDANAIASNAIRMTQEQLIAKQRYEGNLQSNIQGLLDDALGPKKAAVRVATEMNFDATTSETKSFAPNGTVRSQQTERESYNGTGANRNPAQGVPATTTNVVPTYQGQQIQQSTGRYNKSKSTTNYEITEQTAKHVDAPGKVTRLSVAVLVNVPGAGAAPPPPGPGAAGAAATQPQYTVAPADVAKIRNVVAAAAGIDPTRGDIVSVEAIPFAPPPPVVARGGATTIFGIPVTALGAILLIVALAGAGAAALALRRRGAVAGAGVDLPTFDSTLAEELPSFEEHPMLDGSSGAIAAPIRSAADLTREQMIEYVTTVAQENPDSIAKLVKLWLAEG